MDLGSLKQVTTNKLTVPQDKSSPDENTNIFCIPVGDESELDADPLNRLLGGGIYAVTHGRP